MPQFDNTYEKKYNEAIEYIKILTEKIELLERKLNDNETKPTKSVKNVNSNQFSSLLEEDEPELSIDVIIPVNSTLKGTNDKVFNSPKVSKIPPIVLRSRERWQELLILSKQNNINFKSSKNTRNGIKINVNTSDDFRKITKLLDVFSFQFYTYELPEEKNIKVIIRGVITELPIDQIKADIEDQGFHPTEIIRLRSRKDKERKELPLVLVKLPKEESRIYELKSVCYLSVTVESLKKSTVIGQCHRCQLFGHTSSNCRSNPRCVKCGDNHYTHDCIKNKTNSQMCKLYWKSHSQL